MVAKTVGIRTIYALLHFADVVSHSAEVSGYSSVNGRFWDILAVGGNLSGVTSRAGAVLRHSGHGRTDPIPDVRPLTLRARG